MADEPVRADGRPRAAARLLRPFRASASLPGITPDEPAPIPEPNLDGRPLTDPPPPWGEPGTGAATGPAGNGTGAAGGSAGNGTGAAAGPTGNTATDPIARAAAQPSTARTTQWSPELAEEPATGAATRPADGPATGAPTRPADGSVTAAATGPADGPFTEPASPIARPTAAHPTEPAGGLATAPTTQPVPAAAAAGAANHPAASTATAEPGTTATPEPGTTTATAEPATRPQTTETLTHPDAPVPGRHRRPPEEQASYREVFAVREFRGLWSAQLLSYAGDQFAQVAVAILVYHRTHSALLTALAYALTYLPPIFGGPLLSGLADLFPRRRVMIICDVMRTGLVAVMAVRATPFWILCLLLTCSVLLGAPFSAARSALLPDVLPGDKFVLGSAIGNMTHQASQVLGFVTGAAVVIALNPYHTLALDAGSFALSALFTLGWVKRRPAPPREHSGQPSQWTVARKGASVVFGNPMLRSLVLFGWLAGFYVLPEGLAAPYAHALGGGTMTVGLLMAAMPVGTVVSAVVLGRLVKPSGRLRMMGWFAMIACAPLIGCALRPPLWGVLVLWALSGLGSGYQLAAAAAFVQNVPDSGRALAFGLAQSGLLAAQGVGILVGGAAAQLLGPAPVVALTGTAGLGCAALLAFSWTHKRGRVIAEMRARSDAAHA